VRCPNCGQKTSGDYCQWCNYPLPRRRPTRRRKFEKLVAKEFKLAAREEAKRKAEEARQAREAEEQAKEEAELAAREEAKRKAEEIKQAVENLKQIEKTCKQLRAGKIETKEAIQKLSDITDRIAK